jgi:spermidine synthase
VYQVIWVRLLTRVFGATTFAVSALLAAFMAGLGLGSFLSSRWLSHFRRPVLWFGVFEIGIGLYAIALNQFMPLTERAFLGLVSSLDLSFHGESVAKLALSFLLLLPPTTLMGATLPLLVQQFVDRMRHVGMRTGTLYAINTLGAAAGCFAAGFYAIPTWGMLRTTLLAASINGIVGLSAIVLGMWMARSRLRPAVSDDVEGRIPMEVAPMAPTDSRVARPSLRWAVYAFTLSGFVAIGLEVVWTRLFTLVFKGYTYSFSSMLTVFLLGIAIGSVAFARRADRARDVEGLLATIQIGIGVFVLMLTPLLVSADKAMKYLLYFYGYDFQGHTIAKFLVALAVLGVPTLLFGAQFPVVSRLAVERANLAGKRVGSLYAMNVLGSIAGAIVTGYVLLPFLGTQASLRLLAGAMVAMGVVLILRASALSSRNRWVAAYAAVVLAIGAVMVTPSDLSQSIHASFLQRDEAITYYEEGATATVMVGGYPDAPRSDKRILVNGSSASNSSEYGLSVNRVQGCIPFLFERMPKRILATCFGTGITFGTLSQFDIDHMDGVDISPEVIRAAPQFGLENYDVVDNARVTLHIDDGRNFLLKTREKYDIITMEPMPPALAGVADMYTKEFYELCKERLRDGGIVSQWVPLYFLTLNDVRMLYRTFAESFPHAMVFSHTFDTFLVGSDRPLQLSPNAFFDRLHSERLKRDLGTIGLSNPEEIFSTFLMGREEMLAFAGEAPIVTDDLPHVEFSAPRAVDMSSTPMNYLEVTRFARPVTGILPDGTASQALRQALDTRFEIEEIKRRSAREQAARWTTPQEIEIRTLPP